MGTFEELVKAKIKEECRAKWTARRTAEAERRQRQEFEKVVKAQMGQTAEWEWDRTRRRTFAREVDAMRRRLAERQLGAQRRGEAGGEAGEQLGTRVGGRGGKAAIAPLSENLWGLSVSRRHLCTGRLTGLSTLNRAIRDGQASQPSSVSGM